jgi:tetratricopeptide (TPR) repeat protein
MKSLVTALMLPAFCLTLTAANSTGTLAGTVRTVSGKPIAGAVVKLTRLDINGWSKELKTGPDGSYMQVGLDPKLYIVKVTVPGGNVVYLEKYIGTVITGPGKERKEDGPNPNGIKVPLGDRLVFNITLLTAEEAHAEAVKSGAIVVDKEAMAETAAVDAFNTAVAAYKANDFAAAVEPFETAVAKYREAIGLSKDAMAQATLTTTAEGAERLFGIVACLVAKTDEARRPALHAKAEPFLLKAFERNEKDQNVVLALLDIAKEKKDPAGTQKYQAIVDKLMPPDPAVEYNLAVAAHNAGNEEEAKAHILKAIAMKDDYTDSYWLLGVVDFGLNDLKGAKAAFLKFQKLATEGKKVDPKKAGEVKEFLKELPK